MRHSQQDPGGIGADIARRTNADRDGGRLPEREIWLTIHPDLRHLARNATVIDWIERTITKLGRMSIPV
ncbi:hypothetical protein X739_14750 [Mesorhizobium sp. LNHC220B00]|jgi:hypothetical protein|nr:hypothetical protein X739_14750 [Mesorhizobium sp. LNHC220B00]ESY91814.1 hypothetical protein X741_22170 [Mesorhizobium sp. LNHC229A00]